MSKTHYRKVFKSDHLGVADLEEFLEEGKSLVFTIKQVKQEYNVAVAGRKGDYNIAYFNQDIKPLVLNSVNSSRIKKFAGNSPFVEDWNNITIELYIDYGVKMKGQVVGGVRIRAKQPDSAKKQKTGIGPVRFENAIKAIKAGKYTKEQLKDEFILNPDQVEQLAGI